jgi:hypothetical protein
MRRMMLPLVLAALLAGAGCVSVPTPTATNAPSAPGIVPASETAPTPPSRPAPSIATNAPPPAAPAPKPSPLDDPLPDALGRVTKKPFGIKVSPGHSPVEPERFSGYHCGTDFETTPAERDEDVAVAAVCDGRLLLKKRATGYGGVAVESCVLDGRAVTVVYGHLRLASVKANVGDAVARGATIGVLGTGYSAETDGERKHLHLGIHVGKGVDIRGYVQTTAALAVWLDATKYLAPSAR